MGWEENCGMQTPTYGVAVPYSCVTCRRPGQDQVNQDSNMGCGGVPEDPSTLEKLLGVDGCQGKENRSPLGMWPWIGCPYPSR